MDWGKAYNMGMFNRAANIAFGLGLLLAPLAGWGQPQGWHYNAGGRLLGVKSRGNNIWVVGAQGLILHSTDSGNTWNIRESGTSVDLHGVSFPDDTHGWVVGGDAGTCYILRTTNGGGTWNTQQIVPLTWLWGVTFVDTLHGWACGAIDTILKTTDGGATWNKIRINQLDHGTSICFTDTMTGWMSIGDGVGSIIKTTDGGQTWIYKNQYGARSIDMLDNMRGWSAGGLITKTTDGWETGTSQYIAPGDFYGISTGDSSTIWSVGSNTNVGRAMIVSTTNGGSSWVMDTSRTRDLTYYGVDGHLQLTNVTVVGDGGAIIRSTNSGNTWRVIRNVDIGNTSLLNVAFSDANRGWTVGTYGVITHTTNGGTVWSKQTSGTQSFLWGVDFPDPQTGWICTEGGGILKTNNAGNVWYGQSSGTTYPLFSIDFPDSDTLVGVAVGGYYGPLDWAGEQGSRGAGEKHTPYPLLIEGKRHREMLKQVQHDEVQRSRNDAPWEQDTIKPWGTGLDFWKWPWRPEETVLQTAYRTIIRTTNGGALWIAQNTSGQVPLYGVSFATPREGWACGDPQGGMGVILHTTDSGATWTGQTSNVNQALNWIQFRGVQSGWCVGSNGTALWTTDGGTTWNPGNTGITAPLWSCGFYDNLNGFACGNNGLLIKTVDGGRNWLPDTSKVYANLTAVNALDSLHAWTVGSYGMVLGWRLAGTSGVEQRGRGAEELRSENRIKAWPNPFVSYARVVGREKEQFALYDITGRRVGTYKGDKIGADATAGVYFLMSEDKESKPVRIVKIR